MSWDKEYPRPQLRRAHYLSLNGKWLLNGESIKVPYPPESKLSGYQGKISEVLVYEKKFSLKEDFLGLDEKCLLHFGAVDQVAELYLNGILLGKHKGGYLPFSFDITKALKQENELKVIAYDNLSKIYPYGKQSLKPKGMWYTPVSGIWQSVWLEKVPKCYIEKLMVHVTMETVRIEIIDNASGDKGNQDLQSTFYLKNKEGKLIYKKIFKGSSMTLDLKKENLPIKLWSPEDPYLYDYQIQRGKDCVESYFALRTIEVGMIHGKKQILLNKKPIFLHGVLDQGYFAEGIYLPKEPKEYDQDVKRVKALGFNTIRKHIKVEPERFYYACDKQGVLVFQDMVNSGGYHLMMDTILPTLGIKWRWDRYPWGKKRKAFFEKHSFEMMRHLMNHTCIIGYTIFNEGWGQFDSDRLYKCFKQKDPSRLYDATSGWFHQKESDLESVHMYFKNKKLYSKGQPVFLSECGGYTRKISGHLYNANHSYGYGKAATKEQLMKHIKNLYDEAVIPSIKEGLCGCIYTQLSDVETEINGLYTYDRRICKVDPLEMKQIAKAISKAMSEMMKSTQ